MVCRSFTVAALLIALVAPALGACLGEGPACGHEAGISHPCCGKPSAAREDDPRSCCRPDDRSLGTHRPAAGAGAETCGCMHSPDSALPDAMVTEAVDHGQSHDTEPSAGDRHDVEGMGSGLRRETGREASRDRSPPIFLVGCAFLT